MAHREQTAIPWEDDKKVIKKFYKIRRTGQSGGSLETTIPKEAFEREARRLNRKPEDAIETLIAVWRFNNFRGLHLSFEEKNRQGGDVKP